METILPAKITGFACLGCERELSRETDLFTCPDCGENLDALYDYAGIAAVVDRDKISASKEPTLWRYEPLLPLYSRSGPPVLRVGGTPLMHVKRLGEWLGLERLYLKDDTCNPTCSYKDRASIVALLRAKEIGAEIVTTASTGNAASSMAGMAASIGMECIIFVPENAPVPKLTQMLMYGAHVFRVRGTYDDAFDLCGKAVERFGWYNRSTGVNPYTVEGKKTAAFEIAEAFGWEVPEWVLVPTGDGNILGGIGKGFQELRALGWIGRLPRMVAVQARGSSAIAQAFGRGDKKAGSVEANTIADSISVGQPRDSIRALKVLYRSRGVAITVSDEDIMEASYALASLTGIFAEPSAAASLAGLKNMVEQKLVRPYERVVLMITGNGLKDVASAGKVVEMPPVIDPDPDALEEALKKIERPDSV